MDVTLKGRVKLSTSSQEIVDTITSAFGANVFLPDNELYVNAPDAIYLAGPDSILEGENAQFVAAVFSEHKGTVTYMISSGSRTGTSIDKDSGLLTSVENGYSNSTLTIKAIHRPTKGTAVSIEKTLTIERRTYPSSVTIEGSNAVNQATQTYKVGKYDSNGVYYCEWELSGDITNYVEIESKDNTQCVLKRKVDTADMVDGTLKLTIKKTCNNAVTATATMRLSIMKEGVIMTKSTNAEVLGVMYKAGLCASENYMTKEEAERVVAEDLNPTGTSGGSIFYNKSVRHFEEFKYFIGVTSIRDSAFDWCSSIISINIPESVTSIGRSAFYWCSSLTSINIPNSVTSISYKAFYGCSSLTSINIPNSVTSIRGSALFECSSLTSITIPESVTDLGDSTFSDCKNLTEIKVLSAKAPTTVSSTFGGSSSYYIGRDTYDKGTNRLYVPAGATGYDTGVWKDVLCNPEKCGFTISYTL